LQPLYSWKCSGYAEATKTFLLSFVRAGKHWFEQAQAAQLVRQSPARRVRKKEGILNGSDQDDANSADP
jgi:hypothetical protein